MCVCVWIFNTPCCTVFTVNVSTQVEQCLVLKKQISQPINPLLLGGIVTCTTGSRQKWPCAERFSKYCTYRLQRWQLLVCFLQHIDISDLWVTFYTARCVHPIDSLTFRHRASCILGQAFHYSPENAFYTFNQQIYFIIWYLLDRASLI